MATSNYTAATHKLTRRISTTSGDANFVCCDQVLCCAAAAPGRLVVTVEQ
jgi:hypothetical protein